MSYYIQHKSLPLQGLGDTMTDAQFVAAATSIANTFASHGAWTLDNQQAFAPWAKLAYEQRSGAPGVNWFAQVVNDHWVHDGNFRQNLNSGFLLGINALSNEATIAGDAAKRTVSTSRMAAATKATAPVKTVQLHSGLVPGGTPPSPTLGLQLLTLTPAQMCAGGGGTWDAVNNYCAPGTAAPPVGTECILAGGTYDVGTGQCILGAGQQPAQQQQGWWASLSDGEKYGIIAGAVAGVGVIGAGIYFLTKKPKAKPNPRRGHRVVRRTKLPRKYRFSVEQFVPAWRSTSGKAIWYQVFRKPTAKQAFQEAAYTARAYSTKARVIDRYTGRVVRTCGKAI